MPLLFRLVGPVLALLLVIAGSLASPAWAQRGKRGSEFRVGERVEVYWLGKYYPGTVTAIDGFSGWLTLTFNVDGDERTWKYPATGDWVRKLAGQAAAAKGAAKSAPLAKEFPARTWTDSTGQFKIEASFVAENTDGVQLKKTDGKVIQIAKDKLSKEDRAYLEGLAAVGAARTSENPFDAAAEVGSPAAPQSDADREAVWTTARHAAIQPLEGCTVTPDPGTPVPAPPSNKVFVLEGTGFDPRARGRNENFFESPKNILFDKQKGEALVVFFNAPPGGARRVRLSRCDIKGGRYAGEFIYPGGALPVDLSPSLTHVACLPDRHGHGDVKMVEVARLAGKGATTVRRWNMGEWSDWSKQFEQAYFIGDDKLLTVTSWGGVATLWNIDKAQAIWTLSFKAHTTPALSPGRKQLAVASSDGVAILDTSTGDTLGRIAADDASGGTLAFSPDGKRLARLTMRQVQVFDVTTGKPTHDVWFPKQMHGGQLEFLGGSYVLVDDHFLVDLDKRIVLWEYDLPMAKGERVGAFAAGKFWFVSGGQQGPYMLSCLSLPDSAARAKGDSLRADEVLALQPGSRVSLVINLPGASEEDIQAATRNLTEKLKANGMVIDGRSPLVLEATINDSGTETVIYSRFAFSRTGEQATVTKQVSLLTFKENGRELWRASGSFGAPGLVRQKQGQSIQQAVDEQKANPARFFANINLPKYIARHPESGTYGKSELK